MEEGLGVDAAVTHTIDDLYGTHALPAQGKG